MWNAHNDYPLSPRLSDDTFQPWRGPVHGHDFWTSSAPGDDLATVFGTVIGTLVCLVVLAVELLVVGGVWGVRLVRRGVRAWWQSLAVVLVLGGVLTGCQDMNRAMLRLEGCDMVAVEYGYCHMPKQVQR